MKNTINLCIFYQKKQDLYLAPIYQLAEVLCKLDMSHFDPNVVIHIGDKNCDLETGIEQDPS
jgi:hypothetical protein